MSNSWFQFKQFKVNQDRTAMKVGSDSVLLGAWTPVENVKSTVDLGAGTGLLSLMMAQRCKSRVTAIESDCDAAQQASENFTHSPWPHLFDSVCSNIHDLRKDYAGNFDLAIFNPPYFDGQVSPENKSRLDARHLHQEENSKMAWLETAFLMTKANGKASFIIPFIKMDTWLKDAELVGFKKEKLCYVKGNHNSVVKRVMIFLSKSECKCAESSIILETVERGVYTEEFLTLTNEFYL
ncbi:MAG: methyltransferase [Bacteroidia bacterium]